MPIFEHECIACGHKTEDIYPSSDDVPEEIECEECSSVAYRVISKSTFRFGKVFSVGGPTIHDKDGHESLDMTGEQMEASQKQQADFRQHKEAGKDPADFIFGNVKEE